jgi:hypothetical protein
MTAITTTLGGLTFSNEAASAFTIDILDGWYSGPPVRSQVEDRPGADGAFGVSQVFKGARVITQTGFVLADDLATGMSVWSTFASLQSDGLPSTFSVTDDLGTRTASVTLASTPEISPIVGGVAAYTLQLVARDPVKYGTGSSLVTGLPAAGGGLEYPLGTPAGDLYYGSNGDLGRVSLTNAGTATTWPSVVVTSALTAGFYLQCLETGDVVRYDRVVPAGTTVSIDFRTGEVLVDGVSDGSAYLTRDEFFSLPPMTVRTMQFNAIAGSSGAPTATVTQYDGWF